MVDKKILEKPLLYISDFFEKNKAIYYDNLSFTREKNDMNQWILFFLEGVEQTAKNAVSSLKEILVLKDIITQSKIPTLGRKIKNAHLFLDILFENPVISAKKLSEKLGVSSSTANDLISDFVDLDILTEITGNKRNKIFIFTKYLTILKK